MDDEPSFFLVLKAARAVRSMPDGSAMPYGLQHALLVLATYYPHIWPGQHQLAIDLGVSRASVNKRLARLEGEGLITRIRRGRRVSTVYRINLGLVRKCAREPRAGDTGIVNKDNGNGTDPTPLVEDELFF